MGKGDAAEADLAGGGAGGTEGVGVALGLEGLGKYFVDTLDGDDGLAEVGEDAADGADGPEDHVEQGEEGEDGADGDVALEGEVAGGHEGEADLAEAGDVGDGPEVGHGADEADAGVAVFLVGLGELLYFEVVPTEGAHDADAGDVFLDDGGEAAFGFIDLAEELLDLLGVDVAVADDKGYEHHGYDGEADVHGQHDGEDGEDEDDGATDFDDVGGEEDAGGLDVGGAALDEVASLGLVNVTVGEALDVVVKLVLEALADAVGGFGGEELLEEVEGAADDGEDDHGGERYPEIGFDELGAAEQVYNAAQEGAVGGGVGGEGEVDGGAADEGSEELEGGGGEKGEGGPAVKGAGAGDESPDEPAPGEGAALVVV